ncbi:pyrroline-5-carboxylate reductase [Aestuariimicrobium sp. p3-SID1156]|uniref:pyrroline-5-carboxylate reductase n=1 Tax=Aestuariimicrobium sp. p3-SID1156 TaxID=2916038 RepID=UPI00223B0519|nr:pyrroline-5-carboxylate reductase [Aestuariimicrobium sp. p3-SID1156]MCT1458663.1 pyrroline-5-carboxylate reductase [Aestuariimicrobium sp. p3-SID1156]
MTSPLDGRLAVIGAGSMGSAIIGGLLRAGVAPDQVVATTRTQGSGAKLAADLGIGTTTDNAEAVSGADVVLLAVKPKDILSVARQLPVAPGTVVVSVAAGISTAALEDALPEGARVVRAMPNTPAAVGLAMTGISAGTSADAEAVDIAERLLQAVGKVVVLPEPQQDLVVASAGSAVAYLFLVAEAMIDAGVTLGLTRRQADEMVRQTFAGAAGMLETGEHPGRLREQVTSPGGTTAAGLAALEAHGLRTALLEAMRAASERSAELGR